MFLIVFIRFLKRVNPVHLGSGAEYFLELLFPCFVPKISTLRFATIFYTRYYTWSGGLTDFCSLICPCQFKSTKGN